jgi:hypothetical protein
MHFDAVTKAGSDHAKDNFRYQTTHFLEGKRFKVPMRLTRPRDKNNELFVGHLRPVTQVTSVIGLYVYDFVYDSVYDLLPKCRRPLIRTCGAPSAKAFKETHSRADEKYC